MGRPTDPSRAWPPRPVAVIDPIAVAIDVCPHRGSCQCREPIACNHPDKAGNKSLAECRSCRTESLR